MFHSFLRFSILTVLGGIMTIPSHHAEAAPRPPLPTVERTRMSDADLFAALDAAQPPMAEVLRVGKAEGPAAGKAALGKYFRNRRGPVWHVDPQSRTTEKHDVSAKDRKTADEALKHLYQSKPSHQFGKSIDWLDNPTYDPPYEFNKEWSMSFLRMPWWTALGRAYWATGDEKYAAELVAQFSDFRTKHPIPVERSGSLSSHPLKYKVPEWRTLEIAIRLRGSWSESFFRLLSSPSMNDAQLAEWLKAFCEMARHLRAFTRTEGRTNNWTTSELLSLYTAGAMFPEFREAADWREYAVKGMWNEFEKQVYPDGVQWELAPGYGMGVTKQFRELWETAQTAGDKLPDAYMKRLEGMYHYFLYSSVNGKCPAFGDSGHGDIESLMALAARDFPNRADFAWAASKDKKNAPPESLTAAFPYAGQYAMRSGWTPNDRFMIIDAGPYGVSHQNEDNLNYELYAYGDWLVPDPGSYTYNYDSPWRRFMVSSLSHNTLIVDRQSQNRASQRDLWTAKAPMPHRFETEPRFVWFQGTYDAGYGPQAEIKVAHTRSVFFIDGRFWVVFDRALPRDASRHLYETLMMLQAGDAEAQAERIVTKQAKGPGLAIAAAPQADQTVAVTKGQEQPVPRGWKKGGNTVVPNATAAVGIEKAGPVRFALVLWPVEPGADVPQDINLQFLPTDDDTIAVRVALPGGAAIVVADRTSDGPLRAEKREAPARRAVWHE